MKIWTAWCDHFETGLGRTLMACIGYADSQSGIETIFAGLFDDYFACSVASGVIRNEVTEFLFSAEALKRIEYLDGRASVSMHAKFHFNLA